MKPLDNKIEKLLDIIGEIFVSGASAGKASGFELWPFHPMYGRLFFTQIWFDNFNRLLKETEDRGFTTEEIARIFNAPSQIAQFFWMLDGMKQSKLSIKRRLEIVGNLFDLIKVWRRENVFCEKGENLISEKKEVGRILNTIKFTNLEKQEEIKDNLYRFETALWLYAEMTNFENHPFTHSFQGPYKLGDKRLVVRKYFDLRPEFWKFSQNLTFDEIEIYEIYQWQAKIKFDFFERGVRSVDNYRQYLINAAMTSKDNQISLNGHFRQILSNLNFVIDEGVSYINQLDYKKLLVQYAAHWFHALKPICRLLGNKKSYKVPKEVKENIYERYDQFSRIWSVIQKQRENIVALPIAEQLKLSNKIFDPRIK